jgi:hypothetical protein
MILMNIDNIMMDKGLSVWPLVKPLRTHHHKSVHTPPRTFNNYTTRNGAAINTPKSYARVLIRV